MEWLEQLKGQILGGSSAGDGEADPPAGLMGMVTEAVGKNGIGDLVQKLREGGLSETVSSWIGTGSNLPVTSEQIQAALGPETLDKIAAKFGLAPGHASELLSKFLPGVVDKLTPNGSADALSAPAGEDVGVAEAS